MRAVLKYLPLAVLLAGLAVASVSSLLGQAPADVWTRAYLTQRLAEIGYKTLWVEAERYDCFTQGLFVARASDPRSWYEIVARRPHGQPEKYWRGLVVVQREFFNVRPSSAWVQPSKNEVSTHGLTFFGDAEELVRIAAHLQLRQ
jgi:hypothetical protein